MSNRLSGFDSQFGTHGWVKVANLLSASELLVLQSECNVLYAQNSAEDIAAQGCVIDVMSQYPIHDSDPARIASGCYLQARERQIKTTAANQKTFASLLFVKLPAIARQLFATLDQNDSFTNVYFFNEHYVVKPPHSHVEFRWHRDDDEQLGMCVHREALSPYVSAWIALDDVTEENGALQFVSLGTLSRQNEENVEHLKMHASKPVTAKSGDVLFFLSNVWHFSSSNDTENARRAFYAQYSTETITARPNDSAPLSFAIPCKNCTF